jgi:hypothetical protein
LVYFSKHPVLNFSRGFYEANHSSHPDAITISFLLENPH